MPSIYDICFSNAAGYIEISTGGLQQTHRRWLPIDKFFTTELDENAVDYFFGPAVRKEHGKMGKANCKGSWVCWVDVDHEWDTEPIFPPTAIIHSGHGYHLYWRLDEFESSQERLEDANKALAAELRGDSAHNIDRMLRMPGSYNGKETPPLPCELIELVSGRSYPIADILASADLEEAVTKKIRTGNCQGFPSRSDRDFFVVKALVGAGMADKTIEAIFASAALGIGSKYNDPKTNKKVYLATTIKNARESAAHPQGRRRRPAVAVHVIEKDKAYYRVDGRGEQQLSTFIFTPTMLLEGEQDFIVGDIQATSTDHVWKDVTWPRSAFGGLNALSKELTKASWVWLGRDADVRALLQHLVDQLTKQGIPRAVAVQTLGRHRIEGDEREFFVTNNCTLASDGSVWHTIQDAPIVYVPTGREAPEVVLDELDFDEDAAAALAEVLPELNEPHIIWPMLGWFMACPYKPELEARNYRFPGLNVTGTKGSGKTTLLLEVMQKLLGVCNPRAYDANTTHFAHLALFGSSNAVAINFSEFRASMGTAFLRFMLLAYDSGKDVRGRPDQTTIQYPLSAPYTLDGEDKVSDPAAQERAIILVLSRKFIEEETPAWCAFATFQETVVPEAFALPYQQFALEADIDELLHQAERDVFDAFPQTLPTRVRRNLIVAWFGVLSYCSFMEEYGVSTGPDDVAEVLSHALKNVYSTELGRAATAADEFAEFVVNAAAQQARAFPWALEDKVLWFQHTPAYEYFLSRRASQRQSALTKEALKLQLRELTGDYTVDPQVKDLKGRKVLAYGIDLVRAHQKGLDVPESFRSNSIVIDY